MISHRNEAENGRAELGHLAGRGTGLAGATGRRRLIVNRIEVDARRCSAPAHLETGQEEIFFVLGGSSWSWQQRGAEGEVRMHAVGEGDCIVHRAGGERHTLEAGPDGTHVATACSSRAAA